MMTDRELLELAAKAAGVVIDWCDWRDYGSHTAFRIHGTSTYWNPLDCDGDALQLLVGLPSLWVLTKKFGPFIEVNVAWGAGGGITVVEPICEGCDENAVTRRAIVRAAAEIGRRI